MQKLVPLPTTPGPGSSPARNISLWDANDPKSIINLVPHHVRQAIEQAAKILPDFFGEDERRLYQKISDRFGVPTATDNRMRLKFWHEYDRAHEMGEPMNMAAVCGGLCPKEYFATRYLKRAEIVAWLLCPPANYFTKMEEGLEYGVEQMRDILAMPHMLPNGLPNTKLIEQKIKITLMLDLRVRGAVPIKIEQKSLLLTGAARDLQTTLNSNSMEEIEARIKQLEAQDRLAKREVVTPDILAQGREVTDDRPDS